MENDRGDLFDQLNYCDSTFSIEDILAYVHALDEKYAEQKESIRRLEFNGQHCNGKVLNVDKYV